MEQRSFNETDHDLLIEISAGLKDIRGRLFGNGQPGEIQKLHSRLLAAEHKVQHLDAYKWLLGGALAVVAFLLGAFGHAVVKELTKL